MQNFNNPNGNYNPNPMQNLIASNMGNIFPYANTNNMPQQNSAMPPYVNGIESAKNFGMPANSTIFLMDSTQDIFYIKTTDASGFPTLKAYSFKEVPITTQDIAAGVADTLQQVISQMAKMEEKLNELSANKQLNESKPAINIADKTNV